MGWGRFRARLAAFTLLAATLAPIAGAAQEASPVAESPTVAFCGLQGGGGLDRSMTQWELETYFAGGLPTYSWYPSARGCTGDTPFVIFDDAGTFLGFVEQEALQENPSQEAAQPVEPDAPSDGDDPAATESASQEPVADVPATPSIDDGQDAAESNEAVEGDPAATSTPAPTPTPTIDELWAGRVGMIAVCVSSFEDPTRTEWMTPEE